MRCDRIRKRLEMKHQKDVLKRRNPYIDEEVLVEKMIFHGFPLPDEKWSAWRVENETVGCTCNQNNDHCPVWLVRTCLSNNCIGPDNKMTNKCETKRMQFFQRCEIGDKAYIGQCQTANNQMVDSGGVNGYYVNGSDSDIIKEVHCPAACKQVPWATGCQFRKLHCPGTNCWGKCFVFREEVKPLDIKKRISTSICHIFRERTPGYPGTNGRKKILTSSCKASSQAE